MLHLYLYVCNKCQANYQLLSLNMSYIKGVNWVSYYIHGPK